MRRVMQNVVKTRQWGITPQNHLVRYIQGKQSNTTTESTQKNVNTTKTMDTHQNVGQIKTPQMVDFGYKNVERSQKQGLVFDVFKNVAGNYDLMNDIMSGGIHRYWKNEMIERICQPQLGGVYLDVAGGTGDIAFRIHDYLAKQEKVHGKPEKRSKIIVSDINEHMLNTGKQRYQEKCSDRSLDTTAAIDMEWKIVNAETLPFEDNSIDAYTIAFGIRNVTDRDAALREAHRVLKPGGMMVCLEFSKIDPSLTFFYDTYLEAIIPEMGKFVMNDEASYRYLAESIKRFPSQEVWKKQIQDAGFGAVRYENFTFGVAAIHTGIKLQ